MGSLSKRLLAAMLMAMPFAVWGTQLNVKDFGARGDGATDDTDAFIKALASAATARDGGALYIPAGKYVITRTLEIEKARGLKLYGDGASGLQPPGAPFPGDRDSSSSLVWHGRPGGTMIETRGCGGISMNGLTLCGTGAAKPDKDGAGVLLQLRNVAGFGQMVNSIDNVSFLFAGTAIRAGAESAEHTCSDMHFNNILFRGVRTGFQVMNDQGVDFTFTFLFCLDVGTALDFQRGGNLLVNTAQMTNCDLFLNIAGGGRNAGVYLLNNVRQEATSNGGADKRDTLLRSYPCWKLAQVKFVNFNDVQWNWRNNHTPDRDKPLCDIGPGSAVVFESSIFNSPLANLTGATDADARLIVRESCFSNALPELSVKAGENGYFKLTDNFTDKMKLLSDHVKWPTPPPTRAERVDAPWPKEIVITAGDLQTRLERRSFWTLYRLDWQGRRLGVDNFGAHYGSVANFPGVGLVGSGHTENEEERIEKLELFIDGKAVEGIPLDSYRCDEAKLVKDSAVRGLRFHTEINVFRDRIEEQVSMSAVNDIPLKLVYHFMHPWGLEMASWHGMKVDGGVVGGEFSGTGGFLLNAPVQWLAVYAPSLASGAVTVVREAPADGQTFCKLWDVPSRYRKFYMQSFSDKTVEAGKTYRYAVTVMPFNASGGDWKTVAARLAVRDVIRR